MNNAKEIVTGTKTFAQQDSYNTNNLIFDITTRYKES